MVSRVATVAFLGIEAVPIDVQCQLGNGLPAFTLVGLADKAVGESRERVRAALSALGLSLPPKRIVVNPAPAGGSSPYSPFSDCSIWAICACCSVAKVAAVQVPGCGPCCGQSNR
jgi:predicted ATPase with chaperone activity